MSKQNLRPKSRDLFTSVDEVATQIFEHRLDCQEAGRDNERPAAADQGGSNVVPLFERNSETTTYARTHSEGLWDVLVRAFQERNVAALVELSRQVKIDAETDLPSPSSVNAPDISYHVARQRSQLPRGIELLKGEPSVRTDHEMLQSIRAIVSEQEREYKAIELEQKRERNRQKLPPLEAQPAEVPIPTPVADIVVRTSVFHRARLRLKYMVKNDIFLAVSLSVWCALALMIFIDPALSTALSVSSIFLLFMSWCLSTSEAPSSR